MIYFKKVQKTIYLKKKYKLIRGFILSSAPSLYLSLVSSQNCSVLFVPREFMRILATRDLTRAISITEIARFNGGSNRKHVLQELRRASRPVRENLGKF